MHEVKCGGIKGLRRCTREGDEKMGETLKETRGENGTSSDNLLSLRRPCSLRSKML
jgi:hypothetical protein